MIPLARPVIGAREEELVLEVLRSGRLSLGPMLPRFEEAFAERLGVVHTSAVSSGTAGLHLATRVAGIQAGDEVITSPFSFVASSNAVLYENATPVFVDIDPVTLNISPAAAAAAVTEQTTGLLPVHIFGWPADMAGVRDARRRARALDRRGHVRGARRRPRRRHARGRARQPGGVRLLREQADDDGGGRHGRRAVARRPSSRSTPSATRAARRTWAGSTTTGSASTTGCPTSRARSASPRSSGSTSCSPGAMRSPRCTRDALGEIEGLELPAGRGSGAERRSWFVYVVKLPHGVDRDATIVALRERGIDAKPYLPAIHLYGFYRDRFGYRGGEFPNAEDAARRCLALPFFPGLSEGEVGQVAAALTDVLAATPA